MLVYGDAVREDAPDALLDRVGHLLAEAGRLGGRARHDALVAALLEAGALAQGLLDHGFRLRGEVDDLDPPGHAALALARAIAAEVAQSWFGRFAPPTRLPDGLARALAELATRRLPDRLRLREPEGFAHYAVYPEAFMAAGRGLPAGRLAVIGLRTIGTTLAAAVAATRPDVAALLALRPVGHPYRRRLSVAPALRTALAGCGAELFAVVDEGPGRSGSSAASAVRLLGDIGVPDRRIHILSSHANPPGPDADAETRAVWDRANRHVSTLDDLAAPHGDAPVAAWFEDTIGPLREPPLDLSGGRWRCAAQLRPERWPPVLAWQERRKILLTTASGTWLARFAGLGLAGRRKLLVARALANEGFVPEPVALRHGFLLERWHGRARPVDLTGDRAGLVGHVGRYLAARSRLALAGAGAGASTHRLFAMLRHNAVEALGEAAAEGVDRYRPHLARLEACRVPILTDNRLHVWEWLAEGDGILKTDALDHHAGHDLVGCQDIAWDIAGATIELELDGGEQAALLRGLGQAGPDPAARDLVAFMTACYAAFQCGYYTMAGAESGEDQHRLKARSVLYRTYLAQCLQENTGFS